MHFIFVVVIDCYTFGKQSKNLATIVESDSKAPFSIATTLRYMGGGYSFPWIALLYSWYAACNAEC